MSGIHILTTGGTIDKEYQLSTGALVLESSAITSILEQGRNRGRVFISPVLSKDSLEMTERDRETIAVRCALVEEAKILITHGTDTMVETARYLAGKKLEDKTIVLVGAMIPHQLKTSDATFNVGFGLACASLLPAGIYIAMNGKVFDWMDVRKDKENLVFSTINA